MGANDKKYSKLKQAALKNYSQDEHRNRNYPLGSRETARKVIELAKKHQLPVSLSPEIVEHLIYLEPEHIIPEKVLVLIEEVNQLLHLYMGRNNE